MTFAATVRSTSRRSPGCDCPGAQGSLCEDSARRHRDVDHRYRIRQRLRERPSLQCRVRKDLSSLAPRGSRTESDPRRRRPGQRARTAALLSGTIRLRGAAGVSRRPGDPRRRIGQRQSLPTDRLDRRGSGRDRRQSKARGQVSDLAQAYGTRLEINSKVAGGDVDSETNDSCAWLHPGPRQLVRSRGERIGLSRARAAALRALSRAVIDGQVCFDGAGDLDTAVTHLLDVQGIGPWTAQYIAMRGCAEPDAFPSGDLVLRRVAQRLSPELNSETRLLDRSEAWRPWRAYAAMFLWRAHVPKINEFLSKSPDRPLSKQRQIKARQRRIRA